MLSFTKKFRPNAAVIVTDGEGRVLLCYRRQKPRGVVQTVQGGIDPGETALEAAKREMQEELGVGPDDFEIIDQAKEKFRYTWNLWTRLWSKEGWAGQEQQYFLARMKPDVTFAVDAHHTHEFEKVEWGTPKEMAEKAWSYKRPGIVMALKDFGLLPRDY